jgi:hypothetical protein
LSRNEGGSEGGFNSIYRFHEVKEKYCHTAEIIAALSKEHTGAKTFEIKVSRLSLLTYSTINTIAAFIGLAKNKD